MKHQSTLKLNKLLQLVLRFLQLPSVCVLMKLY